MILLWVLIKENILKLNFLPFSVLQEILIYHLSFGMFPGHGYLVLGKGVLGISMLEYEWPFCCYFGGVKCLNLTTMVVHTTEDVLCSNSINSSASLPV